MHHPLFELAYARLWEEFGVKDEMELRETLDQRFRLAPRMLYEMILVRRGEQFVAVRDHTAIVARDGHHAVVHLSHVSSIPRLAAPGWPAGCARCRLQTARECLACTRRRPGRANHSPRGDGIFRSSDDASRMIRLQAYEKAGFRKIDPALIHYYQPDFRAPDVIDATGGTRPLPFQLLVRRIGREHERVDFRRGNALARCRRSTTSTARNSGPPISRIRCSRLTAIQRLKQSSRCCRPHNADGIFSSWLRRADRPAHHADPEVRPRRRWIARRAGCPARSAAPVTDEDLLRVHTPEYIEAIRTGEPRALAQSQKFPWSPELFRRSA